MYSKTLKIQAIIDAQDNGLNLSGIDSRKSFPLVNVLSRYRIIDFCLSNIVNSKINNVYLMVDKPNRHIFNYIDNGIYWDLNKKNSGIKYLFTSRDNVDKKFKNLDALFNNYVYLTSVDNKTEYVLFTNTDSINRIDYEDMFEYFLETKADIVWAFKNITIANHNIENFKVSNIINFQKNSYKIKSFGTNTFGKIEINLDLGIFIMKKDLFYKILVETLSNNFSTSIQEAIRTHYISKLNIVGYWVQNYVGNLWTIKEYFKSQINLLNDSKTLNEVLKAPLYTHEHTYSPSYYGKESKIDNSLLGQKCVIDGEVKNSIIANNVLIEKGAKVENCIIFDDVKISKNAYLKNIIIDNGSIIRENQNLIASKEMPLVINKGSKI